MILEFEDEKGLLDAQTRALMQTCSQAAQRAEGVTLPLSVFIRVTDDDEIRTINREQRGKDAATDVLSFPTVNYPAGKTAGACEALLRGFHAPAEEGVTQLLVLHAEPGRAGSPYCPVTEEELSQSGMRYAALGHIHLGSGLRRAGSCFYAWPGCPEGRGFDECGEKGILQLDIDGETVKAGFIPTAARRYEKLRVEPGADALAAIRAALPKDTADDVYKIILTGESFAAPDLAYLRQALERDFFALTFSDETVPPRDLWRRAGEDSLAGRFLRRMQRRIEASQTEEEKKLLLRAVRCGIAALEGWEVRL